MNNLDQPFNSNCNEKCRPGNHDCMIERTFIISVEVTITQWQLDRAIRAIREYDEAFGLASAENAVKEIVLENKKGYEVVYDNESCEEVES